MHTLNEGKRSDRGRGMHKPANVLLLYYRVRKGLSEIYVGSGGGSKHGKNIYDRIFGIGIPFFK